MTECQAYLAVAFLALLFAVLAVFGDFGDDEPEDDDPDPLNHRSLDVSQTTESLDRLNDPLAVPADPATIGRLTQLPCPCCGEPSANVSVNLWLLGDDAEEAFTCQECDMGFSVGQVRNFLAVWGKMLNWLAAIPKLD